MSERPTEYRVCTWGDPEGSGATKYGVEVLHQGQWMHVGKPMQPVLHADRKAAQRHGRQILAGKSPGVIRNAWKETSDRLAALEEENAKLRALVESLQGSAK